MKKTFLGALLAILAPASFVIGLGGPLTSGQAGEDFWTSPHAYLGFARPGLVPLLFAPGIIAAADQPQHSAPAFSPDGREIYWTRLFNNEDPFVRIYFVKFENGAWTTPQLAPFAGSAAQTCPFFSPDGQRLFFCQEDAEGDRLMVVDRTETGWTAPVSMGETFHGIHYQGSITWDGTIYFAIEMGANIRDIFRAKLVDGQYPARENLGSTVNTIWDDSEPFIAPDESYLIFSSNLPGGYGTKDLYISFRTANSGWTAPKNMGYLVNSGQFDYWPMVSPDGKYLFYNSMRDEGMIFWLDARIIDLLKGGTSGAARVR